MADGLETVGRWRTVGRRWGDGGRRKDGGRWGNGGEDLGGVSIQFVNGKEDDVRTRELKRWNPVWGKQ